MVHGVGAITTIVSGYHMSAGRLKRFSKSWNSVMKRIYVTEGMLVKFRNRKTLEASIVTTQLFVIF